MLSCNLIIFEIKSNNYSQTKINNIVMNQTVDIKELNERIKQESSFMDTSFWKVFRDWQKH